MTVFKNKCHNLTGTTILLVLLLYGVIHAAPVRENTNEIGLDLSTSSGSSIILAFVSLAFFVTIVTLLAGCICCKYPRFKGFINARNGISQSSSRSTSFTNRPNSSEFTIFPPEGAMVTMQPIRADTSDIKFEPLPEIKMYNRHEISSVSSTNLLPAAYGNVIGRGVSVGDWFDAPHTNFPRSQLKYLKEVGYGWFGEVVEGQAYGIIPTTKDCKVIVKILREDSTPSDHIFFLSEVKCFRDLSHPNLLTLLGQCLESDPYLLLFEHCYHNDLKSYLIKNRSDKMELFDGNGLLNWSCQIADGLQHMHQNGFVHFDLAARNCLLTRQLQIKVGDYGNTIYTYKDDYYCIGDVALPLRWSSPESLTCNKTTIETKDTTQSANVWSFGVVLWELLEFGAMPYSSMSNEEVLQKVIIDGDLCLERPANDCVHNDRLCDIMSLCLQVAANHRPSMQKVFFVLKYLSENVNALEELSNEFEKRWSALRLPDYKEHNLPTKITASEKSKMKFDSDFHPSVLADRDSLLTDHSPVQDIDISFKSSMTGLESGEFSPNIVSPSLQNLRGSIEDITAAAPDESAINPTPGIEQESSDFIDEHITTHVAGVDTTKGDIPREGESVSKSIARLGSLEELRSGQRSRDMMAEKSKNVMNFLKLTVIDSDISDQDSPMHRRSPSSPNSNANHSFIRHRPANVSNARGDSLHDVCSGGGGGTNAIRNGANKDEFHPCRNSPKRGDQSSPFIDPEQSVLTSTPKRRNSSPKSETEFNRDETTYTTALDSSVSSYLTAVQSLPLDGSNSTVAATSYDSTAGIVSEERHSSGSADRRDASLDSQEIRDLISESFTFLDKSEGGENDDAVGASFRTLRPKDSFDKELEEFDSVCNSYEGASRPNTKAPDILLARKSVDDGEIRSSSSEEEWTCGLDDEESAESFGGNDRNRHEMIPREIPRVISYPPPEEIVAKKEWICGSEKPVKDGLDLDSIRKGKLIPREIPREISYPAPEEIVAKKEWICGSEKPVNDGLDLDGVRKGKLIPREIPREISYPAPEEIVAKKEWICGSEKPVSDGLDLDGVRKGKLIPREIPLEKSYPPPEEIVAKKEWICGSERPVKDNLDLDGVRKGKLIPREIPREISYPAPEEIVAKREWICGRENPVKDDPDLDGVRKGKLIPREIPHERFYAAPEEIVAEEDTVCGDVRQRGSFNLQADRTVDGRDWLTDVERQLKDLDLASNGATDAVASKPDLSGKELSLRDYNLIDPTEFDIDKNALQNQETDDRGRFGGTDALISTLDTISPDSLTKVINTNHHHHHQRAPSANSPIRNRPISNTDLSASVEKYLGNDAHSRSETVRGDPMFAENAVGRNDYGRSAIIDDLEAGEVGKVVNYPRHHKLLDNDDLLVVDTATNEASMVESLEAVEDSIGDRLSSGGFRRDVSDGSGQSDDGSSDVVEIDISDYSVSSEDATDEFEGSWLSSEEKRVGNGNVDGSDDEIDTSRAVLTDPDGAGRKYCNDDQLYGICVASLPSPARRKPIDLSESEIPEAGDIDSGDESAKLSPSKSIDIYESFTDLSSLADGQNITVSDGEKSDGESSELSGKGRDWNGTVTERELMYTPDFEDDDESDGKASSESSSSGSFKFVQDDGTDGVGTAGTVADDDDGHQTLMISYHQWSPAIMEDIPEEDEDEISDADSNWNSEAKPTRSSLKSSDRTQDDSRNVKFNDADIPGVFSYRPRSERRTKPNESNYLVTFEEDEPDPEDYIDYTDWLDEVDEDDAVVEFPNDDEGKYYPVYTGTPHIVITSPLHGSSIGLRSTALEDDGSDLEVNTNVSSREGEASGVDEHRGATTNRESTTKDELSSKASPADDENIRISSLEKSVVTNSSESSVI